MKLRKVFACVTMCFMVLPLAGCGTSQATETKENAEAPEVTLNVFAAASMTETLTEIQKMYKEVAPNVTLVFNFDSSGTLKTQIQEGADCDVFISAAQKQMNQLDKDADPEVNTEGLDYVRLPGQETWVVSMRPDDLLAQKTQITKEDLLNKPLILPERTNIQSELAHWFGKDYEHLNVAFVSNLHTNAAIMAKHGLGYPITVRGTMSFWKEDALVHQELFPKLSMSTVIAWRRNIPYSQAVLKFIEEINAFQA